MISIDVHVDSHYLVINGSNFKMPFQMFVIPYTLLDFLYRTIETVNFYRSFVNVWDFKNPLQMIMIFVKPS